MNNAQRNTIKNNILVILIEAKEKIESVKSDLEDVLAEEIEHRDNIPENLQSSEAFDKLDTNCETLDEQSCALDSIAGDLDSVICNLDDLVA